MKTKSLVVMLALALVACAAPVVATPEVLYASRTVSNSDGVSATIVWNGTDWSCTTTPVVEGTPCAQVVGSQTMFFYGTQKIAEEKLANGESTGNLAFESDWRYNR